MTLRSFCKKHPTRSLAGLTMAVSFSVASLSGLASGTLEKSYAMGQSLAASAPDKSGGKATEALSAVMLPVLLGLPSAVHAKETKIAGNTVGKLALVSEAYASIPACVVISAVSGTAGWAQGNKPSR